MGQMPIPDDWNGEDFCRWAVCWPDSPKWRAILHGLIENPFCGRFWDFSTGNFLDLRESFRPAYSYNFSLKEVIMACGDTGIANALLAIANALDKFAANSAATEQRLLQVQLNNDPCCEAGMINSGGFVFDVLEQSPGVYIPVYGDQEPGYVPPGTYPDGYASEAEYKADKCEMANLIFDGWLQSLRNLGAITTFNGIALAGLVIAAIVGVIVFPPTAIPIMLAAIAVLAGGTAILIQVADGLEARREEMVCFLYTSDNTDAIIGFIADVLDTIIAALGTTGPIGAAIKTIALLLVNSNTLNGLMQKRAHADYPGADCSACVAEWVLYNGGTMEQISPNTWLYTPDGITCFGAQGNVAFSFSGERQLNGSPVPGRWTVTVESGSLNNTGQPPGDSCNFITRGLYCGETVLYEYLNSLPEFPLTMTGGTIRSNTSFVLRIVIEDEGEVSCDP